jgi:hypothetical protein
MDRSLDKAITGQRDAGFEANLAGSRDHGNLPRQSPGHDPLMKETAELRVGCIKEHLRRPLSIPLTREGRQMF